LKGFIYGKKVALPIVEQNQRKLIPALISSMEDVRTNTYGISEPHFDPDKTMTLKDIDAVIVPGWHLTRIVIAWAAELDITTFFKHTSKRLSRHRFAFDFQLTRAFLHRP